MLVDACAGVGVERWCAGLLVHGCVGSTSGYKVNLMVGADKFLSPSSLKSDMF